MNTLREQNMIKASSGEKTAWYTAYNHRISSLKKLAAFTNNSKQYELLYCYYSRHTHGFRALDGTAAEDSGMVSTYMLRSPVNYYAYFKIICLLQKPAAIS